MHKIAENGVITLNAGDSFIAPLYLYYNENELYKLNGTDKVYFAILEPHQAFEDAIVRHVYTTSDVNGDKNVLIRLTPEDTENLRPGVYYYEIKLQIRANGVEYVDTVVPRRKFYLI